MADEAKWYVLHTYSGYENAVATAIEKSAENRKLLDLIQEINIPMETVTEITDSQQKTVERKVFPGYVMVKMLVDVVEKERPAERGGGVSRELVMNPRAWYVIRNTRGVTGFVGPGSKPVPLTDEEVTAMGVERIPIILNIEVGENVRVVSGPLENFIGRVEKLDPERQKVKLTVSMFGRDTPVELDFIQVQKL